MRRWGGRRLHQNAISQERLQKIDRVLESKFGAVKKVGIIPFGSNEALIRINSICNEMLGSRSVELCAMTS